MKLSILLLLISLTTYAQKADTTNQRNVYTLCFDSITVVQDTLNKVSYVYGHHATKVRFSINGSKRQPIKGYFLVVHYTHFTAGVSRKKYVKAYKI